MEEEVKKSNKILYVNFNQDFSCFAVGTDTGFKIFQTYPFKEGVTRDLNGGIGIIEMLYKTNIIALVGGGENPKYPENKVAIWDDKKMKVICEYRFICPVKNIKLRKDRLIVICQCKILCFSFTDYELCESYDTYDNPKGLIGLPSDEDCKIMAIPNSKIGEICIINPQFNEPNIIPAHHNPVSFITLNHDGSLLVSANEKGTIIRLFKTLDGIMIQEFQRGKEKAEIYSIAFSPNGKFLAISSDRKTIHVFILNSDLNGNNNANKENQGDNSLEPENPKNPIGKITNALRINSSYFNSERSFAKMRIIEQKSICAFTDDNSIIILTSNGKFYIASFDLKKGGDCKKIMEKNIFQEEES